MGGQVAGDVIRLRLGAQGARTPGGAVLQAEQIVKDAGTGTDSVITLGHDVGDALSPDGEAAGGAQSVSVATGAFGRIELRKD